MTRLLMGAGAVLFSLALFGCAGPMGQREAENRAGRSLTEFCADAACGPATLLKVEKIKDRWLVDFETANGLYTVAVNQRTGQTNVSVWDKNPAR